MDYISPFTEEINVILGVITAILTMIFGVYWFLFAAFLFLNVLDYITGIMKSRQKKVESSEKGWNGILKKFGYWIVITVSFMMSAIFIEIGKVINVDLGLSSIFGWIVLATLMVNEFRSILENLYECGIKVPYILIAGLEVVDKVLEKYDGELLVGHEDIKNMDIGLSMEELANKDEVHLKVRKDE